MEPEDLTRKSFIAGGATIAGAGAGLFGLAPAAEAAGAASERLWRRREAEVRRHMSTENSHDFDQTLETFEHERYELIATGDVYDGAGAVSQYYRDTRTAFPDQRNRDVRLHRATGGRRDAVIAEFELLGTHRGPLRGIPATGKSFTVRCAAFFFFPRGGDKIVTERIYFDAGTILQDLGLFPRLYEGWKGKLRR
jgi:steroid delta-isomerase-like uncharacterized protein